jgi:ribosomal protein L7Ae-like RNA K-turn-binding protein
LSSVLSYLGLARRSGKVMLGTDAVFHALSTKKVVLVFLASDASLKTREQTLKKTYFYNIPVIQNFNTDELSGCLGTNNSKVVALLDAGFAKAINQVIEGESKRES